MKSVSELETLRGQLKAERDRSKACVTVCSGTACHAYGCEEVAAALQEELGTQGLRGEIDLRRTGCHGFCERGTLVVIHPGEVCYTRVQPEHAPHIVESVKSNHIVDRLLYTNPETGAKVVEESEIPFYKYQRRTVLGENRWIDPTKIEDYLCIGGYGALVKILFQMTPDQVIGEIARASLRGRGGAGFPTGEKWKVARRAPGEPKYVIVNCDEGDPGAYMDRSLMEGNPHAVLEGLMIGAYAVGAREGVIYVRWEYPLATKNAQTAIDQAFEYGLLGENILGSGFDFTVKVYRGAGAFVSGEETAMLSAIEGRVGEPRVRYVYPAVSGLKGKPTVVNNVETWANVPLIINRGAEWFNAIGTEKSKGTKIFSLVGKINNTGLVEVPMGTTLRELVYHIGGGVTNNKTLKALQIGGPSGGIVPVQYLDTPIDFEELTNIGAMMGSGGIVVMDEDTCVANTVKNLIEFCCDECCGKCIPGREGLRVLKEYLNDICAGRAVNGVIETIEDIAELMRDASLCALGVTATNPVITSLRYFRDEYEAHRKQRCLAKVCPELIEYNINQRTCDPSCTSCLNSCPSDGAIVGRKGVRKWINHDNCIKCGICMEVCPTRFRAVAKFSGEPIPSSFRKRG